MPVQELSKYSQQPIVYNYPNASKGLSIGAASGGVLPCRIDLDMPLETAVFTIFNENDEEVKVGYDKETGNYFIDRTRAGKNYFHKEFAAKHTAPRLTNSKKLRMTLVLDVASVEFFADGGLTTMTSVCFPTISFNKIRFQSDSSPVSISYIPLKSLE
jgi:fructan beta-fructosidase